MLHLVKDSPFFNHSLMQCLRYASQGDSVLLCEDAVIAGVAGQMWLEKLQQSGTIIFALSEDIAARALSQEMATDLCIIDMNGFVALTEQHENIISW